MSVPRTTIAALLGPADREISCAECFDLLDRYVDDVLARRDAEGATPGMRAHLEGCGACSEEFDSLRMFASNDGADQ